MHVSTLRRLGFAALAPTVLLAAACRESATGPSAPLTTLPRALTAAEQGAIAAGNDFSIALLRQVNTRKAGENVFISPFSAAAALGMTLNGAAGVTRQEMRATLGLGDRSPREINEAYKGLTTLLLSLDPSVNIGIANAIFHDRSLPVAPGFVETSRNWFDAEVQGLDFADEPATLRAVNGWAKEATNGRIETVLDDMGDEVMFLMNALYFKGAWRTQFDPKHTRPAPFEQFSGAQVTVPMMSRQRAELRMGFAEDGTQVGELPYGNGAFAMTIVLPPVGQSVDDLVAGLTPERWASLLGRLADTKADVYLPRFRLSYEDTWNDVLTAMGMGSAFDDTRADFSAMSPDVPLVLSFVKQNTFVEVNEQGTEAAAVTTVGAVPTSMPPTLQVDRPFLFAIRERLSGTVLFVGKIGAL